MASRDLPLSYGSVASGGLVVASPALISGVLWLFAFQSGDMLFENGFR